MELAAIGHGLLDRRELQEVVLAFAWAGEQQQHKPNRLQRASSPMRPVRRLGVGGPVNSLSLNESGGNGPQKGGMEEWNSQG
jgi:hypothetical protein